MSNQITITAILGVLLAGIIIWLVRRDHLHSRQAMWWLVVALVILFLGLFPTSIDVMASWLGIYYPPSLLFAVGLILLLLKVLIVDLHQSHLERRYRRIVQKMALLETELETLRKESKDS